MIQQAHVNCNNSLCDKFLIVCYFFVVNQCRTPNSLNGICIPIQECPTLLNKIQAEPLSEWDRVFLKESQCGVNGKNPLVKFS